MTVLSSENIIKHISANFGVTRTNRVHYLGSSSTAFLICHWKYCTAEELKPVVTAEWQKLSRFINKSIDQ